jgi:hypothetical protein
MIAVFWLALAGPELLARPAKAAGCHVPDRPVLGLSATWMVASAPGSDLANAAIGRRPCSGEVPGGTLAASVISLVPAVTPEAPQTPLSAGKSRLAVEHGPLHPILDRTVRPRPPRV